MGFKSFTRSQYDAVAHPEKMNAGQLSRTRWALAIFIIVLLASAVILGVINNQAQGQQGAVPAPVPTFSYTPGPADTAASGSCLDNTAKDISTTAPTVEQWVVKGKGPVPVIKGAGPCGKPVSGVDTGFAKTQTGALAASITWGWEVQIGAPKAGGADALKAVVAPGSDRDGLEARINRILSGAEAPEPDNSSLVRMTGYKAVLQGDIARVDLAMRVRTGDGSSRDLVSSVRLQWMEGDWKIVPASSQDIGSPVPLVSSTGFVPFSAGGAS